jgi:hypothetical protein
MQSYFWQSLRLAGRVGPAQHPTTIATQLAVTEVIYKEIYNTSKARQFFCRRTSPQVAIGLSAPSPA